MENKTYQYQPSLRIDGGYPGETQGINPPNTSIRTTTSPTGSATYQYYFADSNTPDNWNADQKNANSSLVTVTITDKWQVSIDNANVMTVKVTTVIDSIERGHIQGNPNYSGTWGRDITIGRTQDGATLYSFPNDPIGYVHYIGGSLNMGTETYTIAPGGNQQFRASVFIRSHTVSFPDTDTYTDRIWAGIAFYNNLPADYRPGEICNNYAWYSHNRASGAANIYTGSNWKTMRTEDPGTTGNPPSIYYNSAFRNQRLIGRQ